jgi:FAD dependent oxidoreductase TIGR03364
MVNRAREHFDLAIVGAGIVGLAHAVEAAELGLRVVVVDREDGIRGASVRNFGHCFVTAQAGVAFEYANIARARWIELAAQAGFWLAATGTLLVARWPEELEVIREFAAERPTEARVLSAADAVEKAPVDEHLLGALWTPRDLRVDPRQAAPALATWLASQPGVTFRWNTTALGVEPGCLATTRGDVEAEAALIAVGHDLDRLLPDLAEEAEIRRCTLQMLRVASPGYAIYPALATGLALLRYDGFLDCPSLPALRRRVADERPDLIEHGVNLLVTQLPSGDLVVGDTHHYGQAADPFRDERLDELLLREATEILGVTSLTVIERWTGVYAAAAESSFLVTTPAQGVTVVAVTSGIGMTTALGLAQRVVRDIERDIRASTVVTALSPPVHSPATQAASPGS